MISFFKNKEKKSKSKILRLNSEPDENSNSNQAASQFDVNQFKQICTLGTGTFGNVLLVKHNGTGNYYALKVLNKKKVIHYKQVIHSINEKTILSIVDHEFIVNLRFSFKDNCNLYMGMDYVCGGELFNYLKKKNKIKEEQAKFFASQVVLAFAYLHDAKIIYRDLKPENILITDQGYIKITDFGFAKKVDTYTYTLCGTPEYLAPEVLSCKGYGSSVDWWAFGILIYEMVAGCPPFVSDQIMVIYELINKGKYIVPDYFSESLKSLISGLIIRDFTMRLGNMKNGYHDIKNHKWFQDINWEAILNKKIKPSYIPKVSSLIDTKYFDEYNDEEIGVSPFPLYEEQFMDF